MKKEAKTLHAKAVDSLVLAVDTFNRAWDTGRTEAVLILMDRAFELLLKAVIIHRGGKIRNTPSDPRTISFDECLRRCLSTAELKCLSDDEGIALQTLNSLRDAAQHYLIELSEEQLYVHAQAGVTLFLKLCKDAIGREIHDGLPRRILPVCARPPRDLAQVFDTDFAAVKAMVAPGSRKRLDASSRLRSLAVLQNSLDGKKSQPTDRELDKLIDRINAGEDWKSLFPGVAKLRIDPDAEGPGIALRITNKGGEAVKLVKDGDPDATVVAVRKISDLEFYRFGLKDLSRRFRTSMTKLRVFIEAEGLQGRPDMFKLITIGRQSHKRYSTTCVEHLKRRLEEVDLERWWNERRAAEVRTQA